jgi:hypothetical protein
LFAGSAGGAGNGAKSTMMAPGGRGGGAMRQVTTPEISSPATIAACTTSAIAALIPQR